MDLDPGRSPGYPEVCDSDRILDVAEGYARQGGYFCFDISDVSAKGGIPESTVRSHFEDREQLAAALVRRYTARVRDALGPPDETGSIASLISIWSAAAAERDRMCLCTLYGAEIAALPPSVAKETRQFFELVNDWVADTLKCDRSSKHSEAVLACLCGALLTVRLIGQPETFGKVARKLLDPVLRECRVSCNGNTEESLVMISESRPST